MTDTKKRALVVRDFNDAGTGESFTAGETPLINAGSYGNYLAAGLVEAPRAAPAPAKKRTGAKEAKTAAAKPTPAPTPIADPSAAPVA